MSNIFTEWNLTVIKKMEHAWLIGNDQYELIYSNYNLENFFILYRNHIKTTVENTVKSVLHNISKNNIYRINDNIHDNKITIYGSSCGNKYIIFITDDKNYPYIAYKALNELKDCKSVDYDGLFKKYMKSSDNDKIDILQKELDETKVILLNSIEAVYNRQTSLNELMDKCENLQAESFKFEIEAKKLNRCCTIL